MAVLINYCRCVNYECPRRNDKLKIHNSLTAANNKPEHLQHSRYVLQISAETQAETAAIDVII